MAPGDQISNAFSFRNTHFSLGISQDRETTASFRMLRNNGENTVVGPLGGRLHKHNPNLCFFITFQPQYPFCVNFDRALLSFFS